jgi:mannose-6-phosphate isomerase-like protein (cupin superfamily)
VNAGHSLSVQYHEKKDETLHLLSGEIRFRAHIDGAMRDVHLGVGDSFRVMPPTIHQIEAILDSDILEVSTPELDDVVRLSDRYGREGTSEP